VLGFSCMDSCKEYGKNDLQECKKTWLLKSFNMQFKIQTKEVSIVTFSFLNIFNSKLKYHKEVKDNIDKKKYILEIMETI
jgi:hypothetical protein